MNILKNDIRHCASWRAIAAVVTIASLTGLAHAQGTVIHTHKWTNPSGPTTSTTYSPWEVTDPGFLWDTKQRNCWDTATGPARWCMWDRSKSCSVSSGVGIGLTGPTVSFGSSYGFSDGPPTCTTGAGKAMQCVVQTTCLWTTDEIVDPKQGTQQSQSGKAQSRNQRPNTNTIPQRIMTVNEDHYTHEELFNSWDNSTVTFDGVDVPFGTAVSLNQYAPGLHIYKITPDASMGFSFKALIFRIKLINSFTLSNINSFINVTPTATVRFTNNSPDKVFIDVTITPIEEGLISEVETNQFDVPAGTSIDLTVEFASDAGYVFLPGQQVTAQVDVHALDPNGVVLASTLAIGVEPCAADVNLDGVTNIQDLLAVLAQFGERIPATNTGGPRPDVDRSGVVDIDDINIVASSIGSSCLPQQTP